MILGGCSFAPDANTSSVPEKVAGWNVRGSILFHHESCEGFTGGYLINSRLPYRPADFFYYDDKCEILVLLSGTVYNKTELFHLCSFTKPVSDPELIAALFLREGPDFVRKLNGDFAVFILQPQKKQAYLFRDHLGIRPLAYAINSGTLFFSSDITGLCRALSDDRPIDSEYLLAYFKYIDYRKTPDERVKKLLPGHFMQFSTEGIEIKKYWEPEKINVDKTLPYDRMLSDLKSILWDAVKIRCNNRFTAGAHVTGGLDSGIISALARPEYRHQDNFYGFSWSPGEFMPENVKYDERALIIKHCEKTGITPIFSDMKVNDFVGYVSGYYNNQGYFMEDKTAEQAAAMRTNLIFSGWGGDDFISTGDRGIETDLLTGLKWKTFFRRNSPREPKKFIRYLCMYVIFPALGILDRNIARSFRDEARYIKEPFKRSDRKALKNFYFHTSRHQLHLRLLRFYHLQERCESLAIMGYRHGVEYRYPLLDRRIVEYMLMVPSELLSKTDYYRPLLRIIGEGILNDEVRLQTDKSDPVCWAYMDKMFEQSSTVFMEEEETWKNNFNMHFVDFKLLSEDIARYKERPDTVDGKYLFRALVYLKAIHEFTKEYRG